MDKQELIATHPAAWLRPLPDGYRIPPWRWIVLPATTWMLRRAGGVWMNGDLALTHQHLRFTQTKLIKNSRTPPARWEISLDSISDFEVSKGLASEKLTIRSAEGEMKLMTVRSDDFVVSLREAIGK